MNQYDFYKLLHSRGQDTKTLAAALRTTHSHISQMINGTRGKHTRKHLAPLLTAEERALLGWNERGEIVPRGTMSQAEQSENLTVEKQQTTQLTKEPK